MKIYLLDNVIDSFEWSLRHLRTFLETDSNFENPELHTIDYSKCIELYCSLYSVAQGHKKNFIDFTVANTLL